MKIGVIFKRTIVVVFTTAILTNAGIACAFNFCNIMKPSNWRGGDGNGAGYYGYPGAGPVHRYNAPGYGCGWPGCGVGGPAAAGYGGLTPHRAKEALQARISELNKRIDILETKMRRTASENKKNGAALTTIKRSAD